MYVYLRNSFLVFVYIIFMVWSATECSTTVMPVLKGSHKKAPLKALREGVNFGNLDAAEPGFKFTKEQMDKHKIWRNGMIPYFIDDYSFDKVLRDRIRIFLDNVNSMTGVRFVELPRPPKDEKTRYVFFINRIGQLECADLTIKNFTLQGAQRVLLGYDCMNSGDMSALVLTIVGVEPQHNAPNRDEYIKVNNDNILSDKVYLFEKLKDTDWLFHEVDYDYNSVGHFGYHKHTANGKAPITPVKEGFLGEPSTFTFSDVWKVRMLYNYIVKELNPDDKEPACAKLFHPGSSFNKFHPDSGDEKEPRPFPNKYLGKPEEKPVFPDEKLNEEEENDASENKSKNAKSEGKDEAKGDAKSEIKGEIASKSENDKNEKLNKGDYTDKRNKTAILPRFKRINNRISEMSDFQTE